MRRDMNTTLSRFALATAFALRPQWRKSLGYGPTRSMTRLPLIQGLLWLRQLHPAPLAFSREESMRRAAGQNVERPISVARPPFDDLASQNTFEHPR
jgi:hypothetical protein